MRLAIFGGSFNPPHVGHQMVMLFVLATARVDRLLMMPCFRHPFEKQLAPYEHRLAMCRLAIEPLGRRVEVSDLEGRLGGESRTLHTVKALQAEHPGARISLVVGSDLVAERERWYGWPELSQRVDFVVVGRAGVTLASGETEAAADEAPRVLIPDISSSEVRARLESRRPVNNWVPANVLDHIEAHQLYRGSP